MSGIAPDFPRFQRGADLSQLHSRGSQAWTCTTTTRLTGGHAALISPGNGPSARFRAAVFRLSGGCSAIELRRKWNLVARPGAAPGLSSSQARRIAVFLARDVEMGCGGRIRTGDTRRMKPLPYHLATPLLGKNENKHRCQSGDGLAPAGEFHGGSFGVFRHTSRGGYI